jgi:hypothetical protein
MTRTNVRLRLLVSQLFWLGTLACVLLMVDAWGLYELVRHEPFLHWTRVHSLETLSIKQPEVPALFRKRLSVQEWVNDPSPSHRAIMALTWTRNQVRQVAPDFPKDPSALLRHVEAGGGTECSGMAVLYYNALATVNVPSRLVMLQRNVFDMADSHATVEVLLDGKWVMMDPTFGISLSGRGGHLLSAQQVHNDLLSSDCQGVQLVRYPQGIYPARLDKYYIRYLPLYNNVFVLDPSSESPLSRIPGVGRYLSRRLYYEKAGRESVTHIEFARELFLLFAVVLPTVTQIVLAIMGLKALHVLTTVRTCRAIEARTRKTARPDSGSCAVLEPQ